MISGHSEDEIVGQRHAAGRSFDHNRVGSNFQNLGGKVCLDLAVLDAVLDVRLDPVLHVGRNLGSAVDECDAGAASPQFESGNGSGVLAADDHNVHVVKRMRVVIIMMNLAQILAGNAHPIGQVVVAGGDGQFACFD